jgi:hypothetical protein
MGFTFVADHLTSSRLLSTSPRGDAVASPLSLNGLIGDMSSFISLGLEFQDRTERQRVDPTPAVQSPVRQAHPFDGFDRLPFDKLRVCDTAGRLRMTLSRVEWVRAPSKVEGLALAVTSEPRFLPVRSKTRFAVGAA